VADAAEVVYMLTDGLYVERERKRIIADVGRWEGNEGGLVHVSVRCAGLWVFNT
jgi:hypothetical protein